MPVSGDPVDLIHRTHQRVEAFGKPLDLTHRLATSGVGGRSAKSAALVHWQ